MERILDFSKISPEDISNVEKYSNDEYISWCRINQVVVPKREQSTIDTPEYEARVMKAMGVPSINGGSR